MMFCRQFGAEYDRRGFARFGKRYGLVRRACRVDGYRRRTRFENAKVGHTPLGHVMRTQYDTAVRAYAIRRKEPGGSQRQLVYVLIGVLLLSPVSLYTHRNSGG